MMYLVSVVVGGEHERVVGVVLQTAEAFLAGSGSFERTELGAYRRPGRGESSGELLRLSRFTARREGANGGPNARALEGVLRSTLTAAGASGEVRVFVADAAPTGEA